jgi:ABC-2 type transport system permease protein
MRWLSGGRILAIARKEFDHLRRDRLTGGMIAGIPLIMSLLFGYGINNDVRALRAIVVDEANTRASRALVQDAVASQVIEIVAREASPNVALARIAAGDASVALIVPADFEERLAKGTRPLAQLMIDDSDPVVLGAARSLAPLPAEGEPAGVAPDLARTAPVLNGAPRTFEVRALYNPERRSAVFIVPGLCGVILNFTMVLFTSIAIVRERERGNLELLITTPVLSLELMIGKIIPYVFIGYLQVTLILLLGAYVFKVPIRGSLVDLYLGAGLFVTSVLTLGLLISTVAETQFQAFQLTFISFLPQLLLSGFMFPFEGMPLPVQYLAELFPLTHFLRVARGIVLRDADIGMLAGHLWPLGVFFAVVMTAAVLRFRKRLD